MLFSDHLSELHGNCAYRKSNITFRALTQNNPLPRFCLTDLPYGIMVFERETIVRPKTIETGTEAKNVTLQPDSDGGVFVVGFSERSFAGTEIVLADIPEADVDEINAGNRSVLDLYVQADPEHAHIYQLADCTGMLAVGSDSRISAKNFREFAPHPDSSVNA